jgi:glycerophosphoryl diester phosphodiesterase
LELRHIAALFREAWADFVRCWPRLFATDIVFKLAALVLLTPLVGIALRTFVAFSGNTVVADQDILLFVLSPLGVVALIVVVSAVLAIAALQQACLLSIGLGAIREPNIGLSVVDALWLVARRTASILRLAVRLVVRVLLVMAPFFAAAGTTYWWFLTDFDINYYLTERPPEFRNAAILIGAILIASLVVLVPRLLSWTFALPIHLFEEPSPSRAIASSERRSRGIKRLVTIVLMSWVAGSVLLSSLALGSVGLLGRFLVPRVQSSIPLLIFVIGALALLWSLLNFVITWLQASSFALLTVRLYSGLESSEAATLPAATGRPHVGSGWIFSAKTLVLGLGAASIVAAVIGYVLFAGVQLEDDVVVIAHRGAAGRAPENTSASIRAALEDGADFVEIDVQETADGEVVVLHDSDFMKIGADPRKIWNLTFDQAREIDIGSWYAPEFSAERILRLDEVLELAKGKALVDIELKYYGHDQMLEQRVIDVVEAAGMASNVVIMSLKQQGIHKVRALRQDWTVGLLAATAVGDITRVDVDFLAVHAGMATSRFIAKAHSAGKDVYVWTVNDAVHMSRMMSRGVDGLITDEPALLRTVLEERAQLSSIERLLLEAAFWLGAVANEPPPEDDLG